MSGHSGGGGGGEEGGADWESGRLLYRPFIYLCESAA